MTGTYWDTSLLLKLYAVETGSEAARQCAGKEHRLVISELAQAEIASAFHRKMREGEWTSQEVRESLEQFDWDVANGFLVLLPITSAIWRRVRTVYEQAPGNFYLRAPDAIHLATAAEEEFPAIYSNDRHLLAAAPYFNVIPINPIVV